jgi:hypothetical protein
LAPLKRDLESETDGEDYYGILEAKSVRIQNRISPILKALPFQGEAGSEALLQAIQYFKDKDGVMDRSAPREFLKPIEQKAVLGSDRDLRVSLYKALLFIHVMGAIKSGTLNLEHSYKYRTLDNYMIDRDRWQRSYQTAIAGLRRCCIPPAMGRSLRLKSSLSTRTTRSNISAKAKVLASTASSTSGTCYFTRQSSVPLNERTPM